MKKILFMVCTTCFAVATHAQNFQLHHDFGRSIYSEEEADRMLTTLTLEQFKPDNLGSWFWFIDLDLYSDGIGSAYAEISREFNLDPQSNWAFHTEYNGGLNSNARFQQSALFGPAYNGHNNDYTFTWSVQALYKQYFKGAFHKAYSSFQLTGVWGLTMFDSRVTFSGYIDFWRGEKDNRHGKLVMQSEPQLWYNLQSLKGFSIGTEFEISDNFIFPCNGSDKHFYVNPTVGVKYTL